MTAVKRRTVLQGLGVGLTLAAPALVRAASQTTLRFVPQSDLVSLDPIFTPAYVTRNHGFMVFDTLYGVDASLQPTSQMVAGHAGDPSGLVWELTLRDGLLWHDGEKVLARDCVASIKRWAKRDSFGAALMAKTAELTAPNDKVIRFRLTEPFPMLPTALAKAPSTPMCAMMPERLANTDPFTEIPEVIGSGPFRFLADERIPGARNAYAKFEKYVPRADGVTTWTSGPKIVHYDRVVWNTLPDVASATSAIQTGEQDWLAYVSPDVIELMKQSPGVRVARLDPSGMINYLQINHLQPPFNNVAIRRALFGAINQADFMEAIVGDDPNLYYIPLGYFTPKTPMASSAGLDAFTAPRDADKAKAAIKAAGYSGERVVLMVPTDNPPLLALGEVAVDLLKRVGFNVEYAAMDYGTMMGRRNVQSPVDKGGWSAFVNGGGALDWLNPAVNTAIRGNGLSGYPGWPTSPRLEELRAAWFRATSIADQRAICTDIQQQCFLDVPCFPLGTYFQSVAYRNSLTGILDGFPLFWNVHPA
jgi:peptide/nickel transport system substrate-binding protein